MWEKPPRPVAGQSLSLASPPSALVHPVVLVLVLVQLEQLPNPVDALRRDIPRDGDHMQRLHLLPRQPISLRELEYHIRLLRRRVAEELQVADRILANSDRSAHVPDPLQLHNTAHLVPPHCNVYLRPPIAHERIIRLQLHGLIEQLEAPGAIVPSLYRL